MALYVMLSRTNTGMGRVIRRCTGSRYNHVSLTLDPELRSFVSFARYVRDVPLAGGFVEENAERFLCEEGVLPVRLFRLEPDADRERQLDLLFGQAGARAGGLIYNSLGALMSTWQRSWRVKGAYTCLELASAVLERPFQSLQELERYLEPYQIYEGDLRQRIRDSGDRSGDYFRHRSHLRRLWDTVVHFSRLSVRLIGVYRYDDPVAKLEEK